MVDAHLHYIGATKKVKDGAQPLNKFCDDLVSYTVEFCGRILGGDFNMDLWQVISELLACARRSGEFGSMVPLDRGPHESVTKMDSTAIFILGLVSGGIRKMHEAI